MKIKLKPKAFEIDLVIYPYTVFVCFLDLDKLWEVFDHYEYWNPSEQDIQEIKERLKGYFGGRTINIKEGNVVIYIPNNLKYDFYIPNIITHEVLHATHMIMDRIGLKLSFESDEAFCYLNGYINQKIFEQI